jgi:hypothetical protein
LASPLAELRIAGDHLLNLRRIKITTLSVDRGLLLNCAEPG